MRKLLMAMAGVAVLGACPAVAGPHAGVTAAEAADPKSVVEALYAAFAKGDGPGIGAVLSPDLIWIEAENGPYADQNPYQGPQAVFVGVFGRIGAAFDGFAATPGTWHVSGDQVIVEGRYTGTNKATGEALDAQFVHIFTVADGKIVHFQQYTDTEQWVDVVTPD